MFDVMYQHRNFHENAFFRKVYTQWANFSGILSDRILSDSVLHHDLQLLPRLKIHQVNYILYLKKLARFLSLGLKDSKQRPETRDRFPLWLMWPSQSCLTYTVAVSPVHSRVSGALPCSMWSNPCWNVLLPRSLQTKWDYRNINSCSFESVVAIYHLEGTSYFFRF